MKRIFLTSLLAVFMAVIGFAQQNPVTWSIKYEKKTATTGTVVVTGVIEDGWHIYGTQVPEDGPSPTRIWFKANGIEFTGNVKASPKPVTVFDDIFETELNYWENKVTFRRDIKVTDPDDAEITITISYMGCNDSMCVPPRKEQLTLKAQDLR